LGAAFFLLSPDFSFYRVLYLYNLSSPRWQLELTDKKKSGCAAVSARIRDACRPGQAGMEYGLKKPNPSGDFKPG